MRITVNILYTGQNGRARAFAEEMVSSGLVEKIRAEAGNERYAYFFPMEDSESVLLIDRWKNQEAIDAHHKSEMMAEIAALRKKVRFKNESRTVYRALKNEFCSPCQGSKFYFFDTLTGRFTEPSCFVSVKRITK